MAKVECELIAQDVIDVEIGGSAGVLLQAKSVEITENGTTVVVPDEGFDGMQRVEINTNTPKNITGVIGVPDGMSLAQLLCSETAQKSVTEIVDDNVGWTMDKPNACNILYSTFTNASMVVINCLHIKSDPFIGNNTVASGELHFAKAESIVDTKNYDKNTPNLDIYMDALKTTNITGNGRPMFASRKIFFPVYERGEWRVAGSASWGNEITQYIYIGCKGKKTDTIHFWAYDWGQDQAQNLLDVEIGEGACQNLILAGIKHLTAENMYKHILLRLKQDEPNCGSGVTITLGTTNIEKLEAVEEYNTKLTELEDTYGYTFA